VIVYDLNWFKATLIEAGVTVDGIGEEQVKAWYCRLHRIWQDHRARRGKMVAGGGGAPSKALLKVNSALREWLRPPGTSGQAFTVEQCLIHRFDPVKMEAMIWLKEATKETIERLDIQRKGVRGDSLTTSLLLELYYFYTEVTHKDGLSDGGPAYRFMKTFAEHMDTLVVVKKKSFANLIRKAHARRNTPAKIPTEID